MRRVWSFAALLCFCFALCLTSCARTEVEFVERSEYGVNAFGETVWSLELYYPVFSSGGVSDVLNAVVGEFVSDSAEYARYEKTGCIGDSERSYSRRMRDGSAAPRHDYVCEVSLPDSPDGTVTLCCYTGAVFSGTVMNERLWYTVFDAGTGAVLDAADILGVSEDEADMLITEAVRAAVKDAPDEFYPDALARLDGGEWSYTFYVHGGELVVLPHDLNYIDTLVQYVRVRIPLS